MEAEQLHDRAVARRIWHRPVVWIIAVVCLGVVVVVSREIRLNAAANVEASDALSQFEQQLSVEDFAAARASLARAAATNKASDRIKSAQDELVSAEARLTRYNQAKADIEAQQWFEAIFELEQVGDYKDSRDLLNSSKLEMAKGALSKQDWKTASDLLSTLPKSMEGVETLAKSALDNYSMQNYKEGIARKNNRDYANAIAFLTQAKNLGGEVPADIDEQLATITKLKAEADAAAVIEQIRRDENFYSGGRVGIAVSEATFRQSVGRHSAGEGGTFVLVYVGVKNFDADREHANPNNFTLSTPRGHTSAPDTETYGLNGYFDAVNLRQGQSAAGWLVFYMPVADTYVLNYHGFQGDASKKIAPR